jgi:hypothetical protein
MLTNKESTCQLAPRPACPVRTWHSGEPDICPFAPHSRLWATADQRSGGRLLASLNEAGTSKRPFARPHRLFPLGNPRNGVGAPGLSLQRLAVLSSDPFGFQTPSPALRFAPVRVRSSPGARCPIPVRQSRPLFELPLPFGLIRPSGSKRSARFVTGKLTLAKRPLPPRSPPPGLVLLRPDCGSTLRARYAPLGSLRLQA